MATEKICASPIPPLYTAHTGRLLLFYLFMLPFALRSSNVMAGMGTVITCFSVSFAMIGLDEMSHLCEQPFRLMPLYQLSKNSMMDVADSILQRPPDSEIGTSNNPAIRPPYWPDDSDRVV
jgi:predicted membrane chloride channel (bestrophin family)